MRIQNPFIGGPVIRAFRVALLVMIASATAYADRLEVSIDDGQTWVYQSTVRFTISNQDSTDPGPRVAFLMTYNQPYLVRSTVQPGGSAGKIDSITLDLNSTSGYVHLGVVQASSVGTINLVAGAPANVYTSVLNTNITGNLGSAYVKAYYDETSSIGGYLVLRKSDWTAGVGGNVTGNISCREPDILAHGSFTSGTMSVADNNANESGSIVFEGDIDGTVTVPDAGRGFFICARNLEGICSEDTLPTNIEIGPASGAWEVCGVDLPEVDTDCDGVADATDNCALTANADQADADADGVGDACEVVYVKHHTGQIADGTSWDHAYKELYDALDATNPYRARPGQDVWVAAGTYKPATQGSARTYSFVLTDSINLRGGFAGSEDPATFDLSTRDFATNETILSGDLASDDGTNFTNRSDNAYHVVGAASASGTALLDGFTIRGGYADGSGTAEANAGAGVYITGSAPTVVNCTITDNLAVYSGGGMALHADSGAAVTNSVIGGNVAQYGGGVDCVSSHAVLRGSWIVANSALAFTAESYGGGVFCDADSEIPTLENCAIAGNWSDYDGGGLYVQGRGITVRSSLIVANTSYRHGGAGYWVMNGSDGAGEVTNCTFNNNLAGGYGGAICKVASQTLAVRNSILWDDLATWYPEVYNDAGSIAVSYCDVSGGYAGTGNINQDPAFVDVDPDTWQDNDYHLSQTSVCRNAGHPGFAPAPGETDIDGDVRLLYGLVDMGADELVVACNQPPVDSDGDNDVDLTDFGTFQGCFNGPNRPYANGGDWLICACMDAEDRDGDVDLVDFGFFQGCFNGPNRPPACSGQTLAGNSLPQSNALDSFDVTFDLQSPQAGQTLTAGTPVEWHALVSVTGDNQGLGGFMFSLFLGPSTGPEPGPDGIWGTSDDTNLASVNIDAAYWSETFAVAGPNGKPTTGAWLTTTGSGGGPGMNVATSTGYADRPGRLLQVGAGHLDWSPWHYRSIGKNPGWEGSHTWGVGLDGRKETLLLDTDGSYGLNVGWIDTTNLAAGHYVLTLVPADQISLLLSGVDLSVTQPGGIIGRTNAVSGPVSIEFDVTSP